MLLACKSRRHLFGLMTHVNPLISMFMHWHSGRFALDINIIVYTSLPIHHVTSLNSMTFDCVGFKCIDLPYLNTFLEVKEKFFDCHDGTDDQTSFSSFIPISTSTNC